MEIVITKIAQVIHFSRIITRQNKIKSNAILYVEF